MSSPSAQKRHTPALRPAVLPQPNPRRSCAIPAPIRRCANPKGPRSSWRAVIAGITLLVATATPVSSIRAEPIRAEAELSVPAGQPETTSALQDRAILAARRAALVTALDELPSQDMDPELRRSALAHYEVWTSSYRVIHTAMSASGARAQVEVDIDIPRLQKQTAPQKDDGQAMFAWGRAHVGEGCTLPELQGGAIEQSLRDMGVLREDAPQTISMQLDCSSLGPVSFTRFVAASARARVKLGEREVQLSRAGFALEPDRALSIAFGDLVSDLADNMASDKALDLRIRVHEPWPARRLRHLERVLRESIPGVESAKLLGISAQGDAILSVKSHLGATRLGSLISQVQFPGFDVEELRIQSKHSMSIRFSNGPGDQPIDTSSQPADPPRDI